jgi:hypothetical protein
MAIAGFVLAILAFLLSVFNAYKTWLEKAKLEVLPAPTAELLSEHQDQRVNAVRVSCNFVNPTGRLATLHYLELEIRALHGPRMDYLWKEFWGAPEPPVLKRIGDAAPIVVGRYDSVFQTVVFRPIADAADKWPDGRYSMTLRGWVNRSDRWGEPNAVSRGHNFTMTFKENARLSELVGWPNWVSVAFTEWLPPRT